MRTYLACCALGAIIVMPIQLQAGWNPVKTIKEGVEVIREVVPAHWTDARVKFYNETDRRITVSMDGDREVYHIGPHGHVVFSHANIGDMPTWRVVWRQANGRPGDEVVAARKAKRPLGDTTSLRFNGETIR